MIFLLRKSERSELTLKLSLNGTYAFGPSPTTAADAALYEGKSDYSIITHESSPIVNKEYFSICACLSMSFYALDTTTVLFQVVSMATPENVVAKVQKSNST